MMHFCTMLPNSVLLLQFVENCLVREHCNQAKDGARGGGGGEGGWYSGILLTGMCE